MKKSSISIPIDKADLVLARRKAGMNNPSVEMNTDGVIIPRSSNKDTSGYSNSPSYSGDLRSREPQYTVMVRKANNSGDLPRKAEGLKACKGLKGCEFANCAEEVFGRLPARLQKLKDKCSLELGTR